MLQLHLAAVVRGGLLAGLARLGEHRGELVRVQVALVEQHLGAAGTAVTTPGSLVAPPTVHTALVPQPTSRIASAACAVAMKVSRRIGIGVAPAWAVSPVNTARWRSTPNVPSTVAAGSPSALEHRALLDVRLDVGARAAQLGARLAGAVELDVVARHHVLEPLAVAVAQVAHLVGVERAGAARRAEQAAPEARALLVGPVHEPQPDGRRALLRLAAQRLDGA